MEIVFSCLSASLYMAKEACYLSLFIKKCNNQDTLLISFHLPLPLDDFQAVVDTGGGVAQQEEIHSGA